MTSNMVARRNGLILVIATSRGNITSNCHSYRKRYLQQLEDFCKGVETKEINDGHFHYVFSSDKEG